VLKVEAWAVEPARQSINEIAEAHWSNESAVAEAARSLFIVMRWIGLEPAMSQMPAGPPSGERLSCNAFAAEFAETEFVPTRRLLASRQAFFICLLE